MTLKKSENWFTCEMTGMVTEAEADAYLAEARRVLPHGSPFSLLVDQRECKVLSDAVQRRMGEVINYFCTRGLTRVAVICSSAVVSMQMNRLAADSPAAELQFALNGKDPNWEVDAQVWLTKGVRPAVTV